MLKMLFVILVLVGLGVGIYYYYPKILEKLNITSQKTVDTFPVFITPPIENMWCKIQSFEFSRIIGWDNENSCCVQEQFIDDKCLNRTTVIQNCYIGDVGRIYKWSKINGYNLDNPSDFKIFLNITDCSTIVYPN